MPILNGSRFGFDTLSVGLLAPSQIVTISKGMLRSVSRAHNFDLSEKYTYHLQRGETFHLVKRDRYHLHIRVILKALKHFHVVLRMLHLQVWDMLPSMFHFLSKILVEIMVVLWCHNFLLYLTECCALQHQRFSPSLRTYNFFFLIFCSFKYVAI